MDMEDNLVDCVVNEGLDEGAVHVGPDDPVVVRDEHVSVPRQ